MMPLINPADDARRVAAEQQEQRVPGAVEELPAIVDQRLDHQLRRPGKYMSGSSASLSVISVPQRTDRTRPPPASGQRISAQPTCRSRTKRLHSARQEPRDQQHQQERRVRVRQDESRGPSGRNARPVQARRPTGVGDDRSIVRQLRAWPRGEGIRRGSRGTALRRCAWCHRTRLLRGIAPPFQVPAATFLTSSSPVTARRLDARQDQRGELRNVLPLGHLSVGDLLHLQGLQPLIDHAIQMDKRALHQRRRRRSAD